MAVKGVCGKKQQKKKESKQAAKLKTSSITLHGEQLLQLKPTTCSLDLRTKVSCVLVRRDIP
jgi:hypothetical protein